MKKNKSKKYVLVEYLDSKILNCVNADTIIRSTMSKIKIEENVKVKFTDGRYYEAKILFLGGKFSVCFPIF